MNRTLATRLGGSLLLVSVVALVYASALAGPFQFDDHHVIVENAAVHGLSAWWQSMPGIRPLLKLSYALNWDMAPGPRGFHLANVAVHALNALLVWAVATQWQRALAPAAAASAGWWVALLFALHPAATEAVTYVSGRSVSLMALFLLASLWLLAAADQGRPMLRPGSALLFALALGVRETALVLPLCWLAFAWFRGDPLGTAARALRWHGGVVVLALMAALLMPGYGRFFAYSLGTRGLGEQVLGQAQAHAWLFGHLVAVLPPNIDPDLRIPDGWDAGALGVLAAMLAAAVLALASRRRWPWLGFGIAWYLLQLAPSNSLLPRFDLANERHLYLALPGAAFVAVLALLGLRRRHAGLAALALLAAVLALATHRRNLDYRSETALWQSTVHASPGKARPWTNLGWARQQAGDLEGARQAYECALARDPTSQQALVNLSLLPPRVPSPPADPACPATPRGP